MTEDKPKKEKKEPEAVIGVSLNIGGVFEGVSNVLKLVGKIAETGEEIKDKGKAVCGFTVKTLEGKPVIELFGNIREEKGEVKIEEKREPLIDVFDEKDKITITAELPGVEEGDIKVDVKENMVTISADTEKRKYYKEIPITTTVTIDSTTYKNGILEVRLKKEV